MLVPEEVVVREFRSRILDEVLGAISYHPQQLAMCGIQACLPSHEVWIDSICHIISILVDADELSSMVRSHFDRHCTVKT